MLSSMILFRFLSSVLTSTRYDRSERVRLLIHILRGVGESRRIGVHDLRDAARSVRQRIKPAERLEILEEIFRVREAEERWENGESGMSGISNALGLFVAP
jgi:hypothetical protein